MTNYSASLPANIDIAIVGAGPQALTLVTHLLQKRKTMRDRFWVFDASGKWMNRWFHQFAALDIPHLRSPAVHHPHPNPYALRSFAENRESEFFPPYDLPRTQLFEEFCQDVIQQWGLQDKLVRADVSSLKPITVLKRPRFRLELSNGQSVIARRVVLATGAGRKIVPDWVDKIASAYPTVFPMHSILVFGSINLDLVTKTPRLPIAGETLQGSEFFTAWLILSPRIRLSRRV